LGKEVFDPTFDPEKNKNESPWMCGVCGAHTPKRKKHEDQSEEAKKERNRKKSQKYRQTWPISMRSGDRKVGTRKLGSHQHDDQEEEKKRVQKEVGNLGLKRDPKGPQYKKDCLIIEK